MLYDHDSFGHTSLMLKVFFLPTHIFQRLLGWKLVSHSTLKPPNFGVPSFQGNSHCNVAVAVWILKRHGALQLGLDTHLDKNMENVWSEDKIMVVFFSGILGRVYICMRHLVSHGFP